MTQVEAFTVPVVEVEPGFRLYCIHMPCGGHVASLEEPELFLAGLRAFASGL